MSDRYQGGLITKTPVTPSGPYGTNTAPGIWTLEQQAYWQRQNLWPSPSGLRDLYFKNVTLLLNNNNTNGAQNNTFLDSSTNNFSISASGNTSQGTFSPYGSNWSNYFDGSSYLNFPSNAAFAYGTGDFTIEFWFYWTGAGTQCIFATGNLNASNSLQIYVGGAGSTNMNITAQFSGSPEYGVQSATTTKSTWHHCALVRTSGTSQFYIDGVASGSSASTPSDLTVTSAVNIGDMVLNGTPSQHYYFTAGYISNFRSTKGGALYSGSFTPSTTPLTTSVSSGTVGLLTCQSNRFVDNSSNAFAISITGSPIVQQLSPFSASASYSTSTIGGSGWFDGDGDYLGSPSDPAFALGTQDFTVEWWEYRLPNASGITGNQKVCCFGNSGTYDPIMSDTDNGVSPPKARTYISSSGGSWDVVNGMELGNVIYRSWQHFAVVRSGSNFYGYCNGVRNGTATSSSSISQGSHSFWVGVAQGQAKLNGYICDMRVSVGTARYTGSTYTVPTSPQTAVSGTTLLLNYTNSALYDSAMLNDINTNDNSQVSTAVQKFSLATLKTTGATSGAQVQPSSLRLQTSANWAFGVGDFTVEFWCYGTSGMNPDSAIICSEEPTRNWLIQWNTGNNFTMQTAWMDDTLSSAGTAPYNTWLHCALVRTSGTLKFFINGTQTYSSGFAYNMNVVSGLQVGSHKSSSSDVLYMSQVRITKGIARYTSNFSVPTATFPTY